ncbi:MAG: HNH endonuclease [Peptostreptococcaceae bacterium]
MERLENFEVCYNGRENLDWLIWDAKTIIDRINKFAECNKIENFGKMIIVLEEGDVWIAKLVDGKLIRHINIAGCKDGSVLLHNCIKLVTRSSMNDGKILFTCDVEIFSGGKKYVENIIALELGSYGDYLKSDKWNKFRKKVRRMYGNKCMMCNCNDKELHVHHNNYDNLYNESLIDVTLLCKDCHEKFHDIDKGDK